MIYQDIWAGAATLMIIGGAFAHEPLLVMLGVGLLAGMSIGRDFTHRGSGLNSSQNEEEK